MAASPGYTDPAKEITNETWKSNRVICSMQVGYSSSPVRATCMQVSYSFWVIQMNVLSSF